MHIKQMEEKEVKLFSQLEELKANHSQEVESHLMRIKDLENLVGVRNQVVGELEREVKQKEKMLAERQEQLSILLSAMEQNHGQSVETDELSELK